MILPAVVMDSFWRGSDCGNQTPFALNVADFPRSHYSRRDVIRAGETLAGDMPYDPRLIEEYSAVFRIAYDFRDAHAYPMKKLRYELAGRLRRAKARGLTAARTKRMESIRKKLSRLTATLVQVDDLGGCRAILNSIEGLNSVLDIYRSSDGPHKSRRDRSYIESPKPGGYRSHHLVFEFQASEKGEEIYNGKRVEVQLRTKLQHSWATAVEAVGLVLNQDLKAGQGDSNWLRLFELISSDFAEAEGCAVVPGTEDRRGRLSEIIDLEARLGARWFLRHWNLAIRETERLIAPGSKYFVLQFENRAAATTLGVSGYSLFEEGASAEQLGRGTVIVEVDKVENLREAYPNYFLDMTLFSRNLDRVVEGRLPALSLEENEPPEKVSVRAINTDDYSWLRSWGKRKR